MKDDDSEADGALFIYREEQQNLLQLLDPRASVSTSQLQRFKNSERPGSTSA